MASWGTLGGGLRALSSALALTANRSLGPPGLLYKSNHNYDADTSTEVACGAESILYTCGTQ